MGDDHLPRDPSVWWIWGKVEKSRKALVCTTRGSDYDSPNQVLYLDGTHNQEETTSQVATTTLHILVYSYIGRF